jgi:uncharacterized protein
VIQPAGGAEDTEERRQGVPADTEERRQGVPGDSEERREGVPVDSDKIEEKGRRLHTLLTGFDSVIVAFSGGADSAYLAWAATQAIGPSALCVTADSPSYPDRHRQLARRVAREFGLRHEIIHTRELERTEYRQNPTNRCYYCKQELYTALRSLASERGVEAIADGSNADDRGDYRPGRQAAREFGVRSPLDEVGLTKAEIRELSRIAGLPTWDEPASACLSSRIPYHSEVTDEKLRMIERAESVLHDLGFRVCRVRHHDRLARIEIGRDELARALEPDVRFRIVEALTDIGYQHVTIDLQGYRMGSLNEGVRLRPV